MHPSVPQPFIFPHLPWEITLRGFAEAQGDFTKFVKSIGPTRRVVVDDVVVVVDGGGVIVAFKRPN